MSELRVDDLLLLDEVLAKGMEMENETLPARPRGMYWRMRLTEETAEG